MEIKTLEVKNLSHYAKGSEETPCYHAMVYINGKKAIAISNDGRGSMDHQHPYDGFCHEDIKLANEWCKKKFGQRSFTFQSNDGEEVCTYDVDLEQHCHDELYKWLDTKILKRDLKKHYLFVEGTELKGYKKTSNDDDETFKQFFKQKHPNEKCLNFLPFDDALKLFKECA